jgi:hypothetical protein
MIIKKKAKNKKKQIIKKRTYPDSILPLRMMHHGEVPHHLSLFSR